LHTEWYTRQMLRNQVRPYNPQKGPVVYRDRHWPIPTQPLIRNMSLVQSDSVPSAISLEAPQIFRGGGGLAVTVSPRDIGGYSGLDRADLFVLYIIRDAFPDRPVFFSQTTGGY